MTHVELTDGLLKVEMLGWDKLLWAMKSRLEIPADHVAGATTLAQGDFDSGFKGIRAPGTHLPGVIVAGTFHRGGEHVFYDVHNFKNAVVIELKDEWLTRGIGRGGDGARYARAVFDGEALRIRRADGPRNRRLRGISFSPVVRQRRRSLILNPMTTLSPAKARSNFTALLKKAASGEAVGIRYGGKVYCPASGEGRGRRYFICREGIWS